MEQYVIDRVEHIERQLDSVESRTRKIEQKLFNGISTSSQMMIEWINTDAKKLLTKEEHDKIEQHRLELQLAVEEERKRAIEQQDKKRKREAIVLAACLTGVFTVINTVLSIVFLGG